MSAPFRPPLRPIDPATLAEATGDADAVAPRLEARDPWGGQVVHLSADETPPPSWARIGGAFALLAAQIAFLAWCSSF